ncbi:hypothetical protein ABT120_07265 [Nonomuraea angiospora]|uniref:hypothetical protein n=1 Tax=Nonomuraea angiospora TaxID=46172 RepID=UPI0033239BF0
MLVRQGALTAVRRTASTAAPVQVTIGFAVLVTGMVETNVGANGLRRAAAVQADRVLAPHRGLTDAVGSALQGSSTLPTTVYTGDRPFSAIGVAGRTRWWDVITGDLQDLRGGQMMAVAEWAAHERTGGHPDTRVKNLLPGWKILRSGCRTPYPRQANRFVSRAISGFRPHDRMLRRLTGRHVPATR